MFKRCAWLLFWVVFSPAALAQTGLFGRPIQTPDFDDDYEKKSWQEVAVHLPPAPKNERLLRFDIGPAARNAFFIDPDSLSIGNDGVVRYTLVVRSPEGVSNVSFEGMRCQTRERRLYAFGRADGSWSKSRNNDWDAVREGGVNRHHAALFQEYFCPSGVIAGSVEEILRAMRNPQRPLTNMTPPGR